MSRTRETKVEISSRVPKEETKKVKAKEPEMDEDLEALVLTLDDKLSFYIREELVKLDPKGVERAYEAMVQDLRKLLLQK